MSEKLIIWTYDRVPRGDQVPTGRFDPRGHVRDIRLRWACEEAALEYEVRSVPFHPRDPEHFSHQPFGQVPFLEEGEVRVFESGACLLYLASKSEKLMPSDPKARAQTLSWSIAALNSIEMVSVPWWYIGLTQETHNPLERWFQQRLAHLEAVLKPREWLVDGRFTVADLLMADVLRVPQVLSAASELPGLCSYVKRACARPAFQKAYEDQMAHFESRDV